MGYEDSGYFLKKLGWTLKKKILPFITIKDLVGIMLSEIKFDRKKKYCVISLIHESKKQKQKANKTSY